MGAYDCVDLFLIRHGITDWNIEKKYLGHTDRGVIKHELTRSTALKEELQKMSFEAVFTSDLRRCQETLMFLSISGSPMIDARLREMDFGDWEGKTYDQLKDNEAYRSWLTNWELYSVPNGESGEDFKTRIDSFLNDLFQQIEKSSNKQSRRVLVMTHGGVIRYIFSKFQDTDSFWKIPIKHGTGIKLSLIREEGKWKCNSLSVVPLVENEK